MAIQIGKFNINKFWTDTPILLKYILVISIVLGVTYFFIKEKFYNSQLDDLKRTEQGITLTYQLVQKIERLENAQIDYNKEFHKQLTDIYSLVIELKDNNNTKLNIILNSTSKNKDIIVEKLEILNQSFDKISNAYKPTEIKESNTESNKQYNIKGTPVDK